MFGLANFAIIKVEDDLLFRPGNCRELDILRCMTCVFVFYFRPSVVLLPMCCGLICTRDYNRLCVVYMCHTSCVLGNTDCTQLPSSVCSLCLSVRGCYRYFIEIIDCWCSVFDTPTTKRYVCTVYV